MSCTRKSERNNSGVLTPAYICDHWGSKGEQVNVAMGNFYWSRDRTDLSLWRHRLCVKRRLATYAKSMTSWWSYMWSVEVPHNKLSEVRHHLWIVTFSRRSCKNCPVSAICYCLLHAVCCGLATAMSLTQSPTTVMSLTQSPHYSNVTHSVSPLQ